MEEVGEELSTPLPVQLNSVLRKHGVGYAIKPPKLIQEVNSRVLAEPTTGVPSSSGYVLEHRSG
jgi:hypothetical protein